MNIVDALTAVVKQCPDPYAKAYARRALIENGEARKATVAYVMCNVAQWRGAVAREAKAIMKAHR